MMQEAQYYVYEWVRPDLNAVFYVGKGKGNRAYCFERNPHTNNVVASLAEKGLKPRVQFAAYFVNEKAAYDFEEERIAFLEPLGFLTNKTPGGEGVRGEAISGENSHTKRPEFRAFAGESFRRYYQTEDGKTHRGVIRKRMIENNPHHIPEVAEKLSGDNHWTHKEGVVTFFHGNANPSKKPENIDRMVFNNPMKNPEVAEAVAQKNRGRKMSDKTRMLMSSNKKGTQYSLLMGWYSSNVMHQKYWGA
jgi:hypothetical protein